MRRTFDDLERAVLRLLVKGGARDFSEGTGDSPSGTSAPLPRKGSVSEGEAAELIRRAIRRLKST